MAGERHKTCQCFVVGGLRGCQHREVGSVLKEHQVLHLLFAAQGWVPTEFLFGFGLGFA